MCVIKNKIKNIYFASIYSLILSNSTYQICHKIFNIDRGFKKAKKSPSIPVKLMYPYFRNKVIHEKKYGEKGSSLRRCSFQYCEGYP